MNLPLTPVRCLQRAGALFGRKVGIVCRGRRFTYSEFVERSTRLAAALTAHGVNQGDRVALLSYNTHQLLEGYYGPQLSHAIAMPLNVRLAVPELSGIVRHAEPKVLFFEAEFAGVAASLRDALPTLRIVNLDAEYEDFIGRGDPFEPDFRQYDENAIAEVFYTSGSTGIPKGVALSHRTLYLHALSCIASLPLNHDGVDLHTIPLFHANAWGRPQIAVMMGLKQVMVRRFDPVEVYGLIEAERATSMSLVPTMANSLLSCEARRTADLSSMESIMIGGAAASPALIRDLEELFRCTVFAGYGLTETSPVVSTGQRKSTVSYGSDQDRWNRQATAGWTIFGSEARVVDGEMKDVPRDSSTIGEILVRGDVVMDGYFREPEATAAVMSGDWFHTGDMAVWDNEGYLHIVDRKKDIIISGGENISSIEVEKAIALHPSVAEAAVVSAPDEKWGEIPVAFVATKSGASLDEDELRAFLLDRLAKFKHPRRYVIRVEPLPKGGTGKILKRELREPLWAGQQKRVKG